MKNKKRILFIATFPPPVHGSAVVSQQIKDSKLINDSFRCDWVNIGTSRKMNEIGKKNPIKYFRFASSAFRTFWLLITKRYSICYLAITCHGGGFLKDAPFILLCKLFHKKIVIHQHNKGMANDVNRWPYRRLLPLCYKKAKVILLSWRLYPDIEKIVPKENVVICPNGIPIIDYIYKERNNPVPRLLFLSNLLPSKGVLVLLDALKILVDKGVNFCCDFVGGETKEINAQRFSEEVEKREIIQAVIYHGKKYGEDKEQMFENADIFVHPTMDDCFPLVLLEAMQHGLPCITTEEGGIPDIIENGINGLIAERQNAQSLAECIIKLINNTELRCKMGKAGQKKLQENFTLEVFEHRIEEILMKSC